MPFPVPSPCLGGARASDGWTPPSILFVLTIRSSRRDLRGSHYIAYKLLYRNPAAMQRIYPKKKLVWLNGQHRGYCAYNPRATFSSQLGESDNRKPANSDPSSFTSSPTAVFDFLRDLNSRMSSTVGPSRPQSVTRCETAISPVVRHNVRES